MKDVVMPMAPRLSRGSHRVPADGMCVMELASMVAGEPFTDHPRCVHPTLAKVARLVNDTVHDADRQQLVPLLPRLMTPPATDPAAPLMIALSCVDSALECAPHWSLRRYRRRILRQLDRLGQHGELSPMGDMRFQLTVAGAIELAVGVVQHACRGALITLLTDAATTHAALVPPADDSAPVEREVEAAEPDLALV